MQKKRFRRKYRRVELWAVLLFLLLAALSFLRIFDWSVRSAEAQTVFTPATPAKEEAPVAETALQEEEASVQEGETLASAEAAEELSAEICKAARGLSLRGEEPKILIYHTHTTEAYTQTEENTYVQTSAFRTREADKSVVAVGEALAQCLRETYGFSVIHDCTDHEPPRLATAYSRSEITMKKYLAEYPSLLLFIDLHRDASSNTTDYVLVDGVPTARLMFVVGRGDNYTEKPDFESNYALAQAITDNLLKRAAALARPVRVKPGRYNQHVGEHCLLVEVGHNANTLEQALAAVKPLAEAIALAVTDMDTGNLQDSNTNPAKLLVPGE